ncbi:MAG: Ribulose bisphosphate carboxylase, type III [Candidatus Gottesmanbacteria bacterium GW2011_GWC2_39_8]|uniref:Ribulose bisphosphate carboxylase, type III n=1 Tax=Candidatus Gottesmanbacteria bacterium GW2011_GWC2_39_8 TaxID=1618450 RepID=A0A0G0PXU9_9BACT|nr:MAG: Ribulose bisphosphate carboxylase, type III [Candidatus Gottesmanbacteria bacterium GW2011_GWC2_39_8]
MAVSSLSAIRDRNNDTPYNTVGELCEDLDKLKNSRSTEPLTRNCLDFLSSQIETEDKLKNINSLVEVILTKLGDVNYEITRTGVSLVSKISETKQGEKIIILTHCHSSSVVKILKEVHRMGIKMEVYLTETRPVFQGRITATELTEAHIQSTLITDSEASYVISHEDRINIDIIILGADAITLSGDAVNKVGSYGISLSGKREHIPVFIASTLLKSSPVEIRIEQRNEKEVWADKPKKLKILNPAFDKVPGEFISRFITEFGLLKPDEIEKTIRKNYPWIIKSASWRTKCKIKETLKKETPYLTYLHLREKVNKRNHLIGKFKLTTEENLNFKEIAGGIAAESSVGTWTKVTTQFSKVWERLHARVLEADKKTGLLTIAYPLDLFEGGNIPQLIASVAGNIYGLKEVKYLRLLDLEMPEIYVKSFPGPGVGLVGIRKITQVENGPLVGSIIKPKEGLDFRQHSDVAMEVYAGGLNFVKDDENLTSQIFNPFDNRVRMITKKGKNKFNDWKNRIYAFNISADTSTMRKRAEFVKSYEGNCIMVDILTVGFSALQYIRNKNYGLVIHGHRAMHAALTRSPDEGLTMLVIAKLARLAGIDSLHTGTVVGKMEGGKDEVVEINDFLRSEWYGMKKVLPVASGGLYPNLIPSLINVLGKDILMNFGGGIHGHPGGSKAGAIAVVQGVEAVQNHMTLEKYGETHPELKTAIEHFA